MSDADKIAKLKRYMEWYIDKFGGVDFGTSDSDPGVAYELGRLNGVSAVLAMLDDGAELPVG